MSKIHLDGLEGTNPMGFMAALGVQVSFVASDMKPNLWWSDDVIPHAVIDGCGTVDDVVEQVMETLGVWKKSPVLRPKRSDGSPIRKADDLKIEPEDIREYLEAVSGDPAGSLATAILAEGSLDRQGVAKPSDLYFTAGQQAFLYMVRQILSNTKDLDIHKGMTERWRHASKLPSMGWDVTDDRVYALRAINPTTDKKLSSPGPESLAILGLSLHPVFAGKSRTLTQGCSGTWKHATYSWPIWNKPASLHTVKSLLMHAYDPKRNARERWLSAWGVSKILQSRIRRSDQGGYGTFRPPTVIWQPS